jgi:hypothetical protein
MIAELLGLAEVLMQPILKRKCLLILGAFFVQTL